MVESKWGGSFGVIFAAWAVKMVVEIACKTDIMQFE